MTRVLIVEDDSDFAESLVIALGLRKCQVDVACSGEEAVRSYRASPYDLVFMDIKLPGKNGVQTLTEIREVDGEARVIMMTGFSEPALLNAAIEAGAMDVMRKPFKIRQLFGYLETLQGNES